MAPLATTEAINNNSRNEQSLHVFFRRDEKSAVATLSTAHQTNSTNNFKKKTHRFRWNLHVDNLLECLPQSCNQHQVTELVTLIPKIAMIVYANEISLELFKLKVSWEPGRRAGSLGAGASSDTPLSRT